MNRLSRRGLLRGGVALASAGAASMLAACQQAPGPQTPTVPLVTVAPEKLSGKITAWVPASCYLCAPADLWNKAHPNATVDAVKGGQDLTKFEAALRSGEGGPDIIQSDVSPIAREMLHKQLYDWTDRLYDIKKDFVQFKLRECTHPKTGRIYGIPYQLGVVGMYYREDLLTKAGYTHDKLQNLSWNEYLDLGRKLKKDFGLPLDASSQTGVSYFQMLHWLAGGSVTNKDGTQVTLDDQIGVDTMKKVKTLFDEGLFAPTDTGSEAWWTAARQGKIPMVWAATWFGG
jgi:lactose/L-arabinose transport system substrate-binding protein